MKPIVFITELIVLARYKGLLSSKCPVTYVIPYSSVLELYEIHQNNNINIFEFEVEHHTAIINEIEPFIQFFEMPFHLKKMDVLFKNKNTKNVQFLFNEYIVLEVWNVEENEQYGDDFDIIETELILLAEERKEPLLTDQFSIQQKISDYDINIEVYDIENALKMIHFESNEDLDV